MLGYDASDVVVHHHHLIHQAAPLRGEHADGGRTTADTHAALRLTPDDRGLARLNHHRLATIYSELNRLLVAEIEQGIACRAPLCLGATRKMMHATQRQHLRAVFAGSDMADCLALGADNRPCHYRQIRLADAVAGWRASSYG